MSECVTHWHPPARHRGWQRMAFRSDSLEKSGCARTRCGGAATRPARQSQIVTPWSEGATIRSMASLRCASRGGHPVSPIISVVSTALPRTACCGGAGRVTSPPIAHAKDMLGTPCCRPRLQSQASGQLRSRPIKAKELRERSSSFASRAERCLPPAKNSCPRSE